MALGASGTPRSPNAFAVAVADVGKVRKTHYVKNASLGIRRAPTVFSLFLKDARGIAKGYTGQRLRSKTAVWRMDLLKLKFSTLPAGERQVLERRAMDAKGASQAARRHALDNVCSDSGDVGGFDADPLEEPDAVAACPREEDRSAEGRIPQIAMPVAAAVAAGPAGTASVWLELAVPACSPPLPGSPEPLPTPQEPPSPSHDLVWVDSGSGIRQVCHTMPGPALGNGVYGTCFKIRCVSTGQAFCAKVPSGGEDKEVAISALKAEFAAMDRMNHPNVMRAHAFAYDSTGDLHSLLMPLMQQDMWTWLLFRRSIVAPPVGGDGLSFAERSSLVQVAAGLAHIHARGVFHLDIKPDNVLMSGEEASPRFCLADFGICGASRHIDGVPVGPFPASCICSAVYRPFDLFRLCESLVPLRPRYDIWAFGALVFDVAQLTPQLRSPSGRACRMMDGIKLEDAQLKRLFLARSSRIQRFARPCVRPLIVELQPESSVAARMLKAEAVIRTLRKLPVCPP